MRVIRSQTNVVNLLKMLEMEAGRKERYSGREWDIYDNRGSHAEA